MWQILTENGPCNVFGKFHTVVEGVKWRIYQFFPLQTCLCNCIHNCIWIGWRCVWVSLRGVYVRGECLGIFPWSLSITHDGQNKWVFPAWAPQFQTSYIKYILDLQTGYDKTPLQLSQSSPQTLGIIDQDQGSGKGDLGSQMLGTEVVCFKVVRCGADVKISRSGHFQGVSDFRRKNHFFESLVSIWSESVELPLLTASLKQVCLKSYIVPEIGNVMLLIGVILSMGRKLLAWNTGIKDFFSFASRSCRCNRLWHIQEV